MKVINVLGYFVALVVIGVLVWLGLHYGKPLGLAATLAVCAVIMGGLTICLRTQRFTYRAAMAEGGKVMKIYHTPIGFWEQKYEQLAMTVMTAAVILLITWVLRK